jgi:RNA-binding motif X-linked protein 2
VKDNNTGAPRGFAFLSYSDQRSTVLAVDNFNGVKLAGRNLRVDHVENYKSPQDIQEQREKKRKERTRYADMVTSELFTNATESMEITKMNVNVSVDDETEEVAELAIDEPSFRVEKGNRRLRTDEEKELKRRFQEGLISEPDYQMQKKALKKTIKKLSGSTR